MHPKQQQQFLLEHGAENIIRILQPYVSEARQARINEVLASRLNGIQLALEAPSDIHNALATIRSSEVLGVNNVHLIKPEGDAKYTRGITKGALYWTEVNYHEEWDAFAEHAQSQSLLLAGGVMNNGYLLAELPVDKPLCLLLGNEHRGLSPHAQQQCDYLFHIPMFGMTESLNLSVAAAISLYETVLRKRKLLNHPGDLTTTDQVTLRAKYFLNSVNERLIRTLLKK